MSQPERKQLLEGQGARQTLKNAAAASMNTNNQSAKQTSQNAQAAMAAAAAALAKKAGS